MNKILALVLILVSMAVGGFCQSQSTIAKGVPMNISDAAITGFVALATPTITLNNVAVKVGTLPVGTVAIVITGQGVVHYGDSSVLCTVDGAYPLIASGSSLRIPIYPHETEPNIWLINSASGTSSVARITAEVQR